MCSCVDTRITTALLIFLALAGQSIAFSEDNLIDEYGRLKRMALGHGWIDVQSDIRIPNSGWKKSLTLGNTEKAATTLGYGEQTWSSRVADNPMEYDIEQTAQSSEGKIVFKIKVTARQSAFIEGVYFWLDIPEELFAGGTYIAGRQAGALPLEQRQQLCATITDKFMFFDAGAKTCIAATLNRPASVQINDQRRYGENYSAFIVLHPGTLWRGDSTELELTLEALGDGDSAAQLSMDAETARYPFKGFGGNYAFAIESPVTRYTLDHLQVAFARTEMSLAEWEPKLDKAEVTERIEWGKLLERDQDGSRLRHEFELMQEFSRRKIPYVASIWQLPAWMYAHPPKDREATGNKLADGMWPKLLECIGSYLLYAREKYHAEPDYFSFNEPDIGIRVLFSADEHRAAIRRLGEHFEKLKLKTKLLLGDCGNPRGTISYTYPGIFDAEALKYTAALSFHSWGGATPKQYGEWADMAARVHLPLFVTEAGVDPAAWREGTFQSFDYGLREAMHYQKLLLYARPQAVVFWEYSDDYSLLSHDPASNKLALTERFCMQKQFTDLTPAASEALNTSSDQPGILFTAFRYAQKQERGFTLHLVNSMWTRKVVIEGVPQSLFKLNCVQTSRGKLFETLGAVDVQLGRIEMELPAQSLTTLTTLPLPELVKP